MKTKFTRKLLSALLVSAMLVCALPAAGVFADEPDYTADIDALKNSNTDTTTVIRVCDQNCSSTSPPTETITVGENNKRKVAKSTDGSTIWYLGDFDLNDIGAIEVRAGLVAGDNGVIPSINFAYLPIQPDDHVDENGYPTVSGDGDSEENNYFKQKNNDDSKKDDNSAKIRNANNKIACITGETILWEDDKENNQTNVAHTNYGAMYTVTADDVWCDSSGYADSPGGTATVDKESSVTNDSNKTLTARGTTGKVHLFVYRSADKHRRASIDYVIIHSKHKKLNVSESNSDINLFKLKGNGSNRNNPNAGEYSFGYPNEPKATSSPVPTPVSKENVNYDASTVGKMFDGDFKTQGYAIDSDTPLVIDLGSDKQISKLVTASGSNNTNQKGDNLIYALVKNTDYTVDGESSSNNVKSTLWYRANSKTNNGITDSKNINLNDYAFYHSEITPDDDADASATPAPNESYQYNTLTVKDVNKAESYQYIVIDGNHTSNSTCNEIEIYTPNTELPTKPTTEGKTVTLGTQKGTDYTTDAGTYTYKGNSKTYGVIRFLQKIEKSGADIKSVGFYIVDGTEGKIRKAVLTQVNPTEAQLNGIYADLENIPEDEFKEEDGATYYMKAIVVTDDGTITSGPVIDGKIDNSAKELPNTYQPETTPAPTATPVPAA